MTDYQGYGCSVSYAHNLFSDIFKMFTVNFHKLATKCKLWLDSIIANYLLQEH